MDLSNEQKKFLEYHNIDIRHIFDATGLKQKEYEEIMKNLEKKFAIGVTPCLKAGHTLRTRHGQCIQCDTSKIAYSQRGSKLAYVYVAGTLKGKILKVGFAEDVDDRKKHLNDNSYAGFNDWEIIYKGKYKNAGIFESFLHKSLGKYWFKVKYSHYGREIICYETFKCCFSIIENLINEYNKNNEVQDYYKLTNAENIYNFESIENNEKRIGNLTEKNEDSYESSSNFTLPKENKYKKPELINEVQNIDNVKEIEIKDETLEDYLYYANLSYEEFKKLFDDFKVDILIDKGWALNLLGGKYSFLKPKWHIFPYLNPIILVIFISIGVYIKLGFWNIIIGIIILFLSWIFSLPSFKGINKTWHWWFPILIFMYFYNPIISLFGLIIWFNQIISFSTAGKIILRKCLNNKEIFEDLYYNSFVSIQNLKDGKIYNRNIYDLIVNNK